MTLRENNLREIEGGNIMESQGILVANRKSLLERPQLLEVRGCGGAVPSLGRRLLFVRGVIRAHSVRSIWC